MSIRTKLYLDEIELLNFKSYLSLTHHQLVSLEKDMKAPEVDEQKSDRS